MLSANTYGKTKTYADMFKLVYRNRLYYSSYLFLKKSVETNTRVSEKAARRVIDIIHPSVFIHDPELDKFINTNTQLDFAVGLRRFFLNDFNVAEKKLTRIDKKHSMYVEANYLLGLVELRKNKLETAEKYFTRCVAASSSKRMTRLKPESYVRTFRNRCIQQVGRINYAQKDFKKSLRIYNYVKSDDYIWPRFLMDKAWTYYMLGQNERALGSVITYKAPLLQRFMVPEANYIRGLIYYDMCYFEKTESIYNEFNQSTWRFRKIAQTASRNRLLRLIVSRDVPENENDQFLYYYLKGFKKDIRYMSFIEARKQIAIEIKRLSKIKSMKQAKIFLEYLYYYQKAVKEDFQDFLKSLTNDYYTQIVDARKAFVKLNLMVSLKKRKQIKKKNTDEFEDTFAEKSLSNIPNIDEKFIWDFQGGFWADELGDYAVALENQCQN